MTIVSGVYALDSFDPAGAEYMRNLFPDVVEPGTESWSSWRDDAVGLLVGSSPVTGDDIRASKKLKFIVRHGAGYDRVDIDACKKKGIVVCNCPGTNAVSVAEVALSLTCAAAKNLLEVGRQIRAGEKLNKKYKSLFSASLLTGKTFGLIGGGAIGQLTAKKFIGAFDAQIVMYDPYVPTDGTGPWAAIPHTRVTEIADMLPVVDVLSLHVPLLPSTKDLITLSSLSTMKPTAILINTARGGIVNEDDLFVALKNGIIAGAGIDAWVSEPPTKEVYGDNLDLDNLVATPHIGAAPAEMQTALCKSMCDHMLELVRGQAPRDRVA